MNQSAMNVVVLYETPLIGFMTVLCGTPQCYQCGGDDPVHDLSIVINVVMIAVLAFPRVPAFL